MKKDSLKFYLTIKRRTISVTIFLLGTIFQTVPAHAFLGINVGNITGVLDDYVPPVIGPKDLWDAGKNVGETLWNIYEDEFPTHDEPYDVRLFEDFHKTLSNAEKIIADDWKNIVQSTEQRTGETLMNLHRALYAVIMAARVEEALRTGDWSKVLDKDEAAVWKALINQEQTDESNALQQKTLSSLSGAFNLRPALLAAGSGQGSIILPMTNTGDSPSEGKSFTHKPGVQAVKSYASAMDLQLIASGILEAGGNYNIPLTANLRLGMVLDQHSNISGVDYDWILGKSAHQKFTIASGLGFGHSFSSLGMIFGGEVVASLTCTHDAKCMTTQIRFSAILDIDVPRVMQDGYDFNVKNKAKTVWLLQRLGFNRADAQAQVDAMASQNSWSWSDYVNMNQSRSNVGLGDDVVRKAADGLGKLSTTIYLAAKDGESPAAVVEYVQDALWFICHIVDVAGVACSNQNSWVPSFSVIWLNNYWAKDPTQRIVQGWRGNPHGEADQISFSNNWQPTVGLQMQWGNGKDRRYNNIIGRIRLMTSLVNAYIIPLTHNGTLRYTTGTFFAD